MGLLCTKESDYIKWLPIKKKYTAIKKKKIAE